MRNEILSQIQNIQPWDDLEKNHIQFVTDWILSGADLCRIQKPNIPNIHLVSYFVLIDFIHMKILLGEHKKANLWLPSGGHVEPDELPLDTVKRECREELRMDPDFFSSEPFFITVAPINEKGILHQDVSLWYLLQGDSKIPIAFCEEEYRSVQWFDIHNIPSSNQSDPNIERFRDKLLVRAMQLAPVPVACSA